MKKTNSNSGCLSYDELEQFNSFLLGLNRASSRRKITTLFRGDKISNIFNRLGVEYEINHPNYQDLLDRLFMVGDKARHFYNEQINQFGGRQIRVEDLSENTFGYIFDHLYKAAKSKETNSKKFFEKNEKLKNYFLDKKNKGNFLLVSSESTIAERQFFKYH